MKKIISLVLSLALVFSFCAMAFAADENVTNLIGDGKTTVSIAFKGQSFDEKALFDILQKFYDETGISVKVIYVASSGGWGGYFSKLQTMIAGGDTPDLSRVAIEGFRIFQENDLIVPINEYEEKYPEFAAMVADNHEKLVEPFNVDGKLYGYGFDWNNICTHLNTNMLAEAGLEIPDAEWTIDEFLEYARAMTGVRADGTKYYGCEVPLTWFQMSGWLYNWGATILNEDWTEAAINSPEAVAAIQYLHDLIYVEKVAPVPSSLSGTEFMTDQTAMTFYGRWLLLTYINNNFNDVALAYVPTAAQNQPVSGVGIYAIMKDSECKDEAYKLAAWLSSAEAQEVILETKAIPASKNAMDTVVRNSDYPINSYIFADCADTAISVECPACYADLQLIFDRYISLIYADEMGVQEALDACKEEMDLVLMGF